MKHKKRFYYSLTKVFPQSYVDRITKLFVYAGDRTTDARVYLGEDLLFGLICFFGVNIFSWAIFGSFTLKYFAYSLIAFFLVLLYSYVIIYYKSEKRTKEIENALPDALHLIATNLKTGMTPYDAMKLSARDEFGALSELFSKATARSLGGSFSTALLNLRDEVNSTMFGRTVKLFSTSLKSGGKLALLLEELAADISQTKQLGRELVTSTKSYTAFIMFTVVIGTPLLLAISINFVQIIENLQATTAGSLGGEFGLGGLVGELTITPGFLTGIAYVLLIATPIFATMLIGVISEGKAMNGLRKAPFLIITCLIIFFICKNFVAGFLGNTFG